MALPKHKKKHEYTVTLPSGLKVKFRPWIVREEQEFMYATEGLDDEVARQEHIETLISKCITDKLDVSTLSETDFLALALELRKRSKGEDHEIVYTCPKCDARNTGIKIDLNKDVQYRAFKSEPLEVGEFFIEFRDLTRPELKTVNDLKTAGERSIAYLAASLKSVSTEEQTYTKFTEEEALEFFETMDPKDFGEVCEKFAGIIPLFSVHKKLKCENCGNESIVYVDNVSDFFV